MNTGPDRFEKIYEVNSVPITLFEIEEWWETTEFEQRKPFRNPDMGDDARYKIASQIVHEMSVKNQAEKLEILTKFKKAHQEQRESLGVIMGRNNRSLRYDPDLNRIKSMDFYDMDPYAERKSHNAIRTGYGAIENIPRPPDLPQIVSNDPTGHGGGSIFQQALRMAEAKLRNEQMAEMERKRQSDYIRYEQQKNYYNKTQKSHLTEKKKSWRELLGFSDGEVITKEQMIKTFRTLAMKCHPDVGGDAKDMQNLIDARNQALKEFD